MTIIRTVSAIHSSVDRLRLEGKRIAVVPTMGALHEGHLTLIRTAKSAAEVVIVTVFVNPAQFGKGEDFDRYPRSWDRDEELASKAGADILFAPDTLTMYPEGYHTFVTVEAVSDVLEGKDRPGHFRGVATVIVKLFNCTKPHIAVFGQKDAQQVAVLRRMARDLDYDLSIMVVPTVREPDGLALSSRNVYLTVQERTEAPVLYKSLCRAGELVISGSRDSGAIRQAMEVMIRTNSSAEINYISIADAETLAEQPSLQTGEQILVSLAARFGRTRLIDNTVITVP